MIFKDIIFHWSYNAISIVAPLLLIPVLTRRLGLDSYGALAYLQILASSAGTLIDFGFGVIGTRLLANSTDTDRNKTFTVLIASHFILSVFWLLIFILIFSVGSNQVGWVELTLVFVSSSLLYLPPSYVLIFFGMQSAYGITGFLSRVVHILFVLTFVFDKNGALLYFFGLAFINLIVSMINMHRLRRMGVGLYFSAGDFSSVISALRLGFVFFIQRLSTLLPAIGVPFIIGALGTRSDIAVYSIVDKLRVVIWQLLSPILQNRSGKIFSSYKNNSYSCKSEIGNVFFVVLGISLSLAVVAFCFSDYILTIIGGGQMNVAHDSWRLGSIGVIFSGLLAFFNVIIFPLRGRLQFISVISWIFGGAAISILVGFYREYGVILSVAVLAAIDFFIVICGFFSWHRSRLMV